MRRLWLAVGIGHLPRLDGVEGIFAIGIGAAAAEAAERGIGQRALVLRIGKAALRVGLPDFKHGVRHRGAVAVEYPARNANPFARGIRRDEVMGEGVVPGVFAARRQPVFEERADGLRWSQSLHDFVSIGVALRPRSTMLKR